MSCKTYRNQIAEDIKFDEEMRVETAKFQARIDAGDPEAIEERRQVEEDFATEKKIEKALREELEEVDAVLSSLEDANIRGVNIQRLILSRVFNGMNIEEMKKALEAAKTFISQNQGE